MAPALVPMYIEVSILRALQNTQYFKLTRVARDEAEFDGVATGQKNYWSGTRGRLGLLRRARAFRNDQSYPSAN